MDYALIHQAKFNIKPSGDAYFISEDSPRLFLIADGLGSGKKARHAADMAVSLAKKACLTPPSGGQDFLLFLFEHCHQKLKHSRGAALGAVLLDSENSKLLFCGVGNIRLVVAGETIKSISSQPGIIGSQIPRKISVKNISMEDYITGFLFSDGISMRSVFKTAAHPYRLPEVLAAEIERINGNTDDRTLIVFSIKD